MKERKNKRMEETFERVTERHGAIVANVNGLGLPGTTDVRLPRT
jgi:hypothetical protein